MVNDVGGAIGGSRLGVGVSGIGGSASGAMIGGSGSMNMNIRNDYGHGNNASSPSKRGPGRKKKKIFATAHLPNEERDELHIEIYRYFQWLQKSLDGTSTGMDIDNGGNGGGGNDQFKRKAASGAAGINVAAMRNLMENMEQTFKVVRTTAGPNGGAITTMEGGIQNAFGEIGLPATVAATGGGVVGTGGTGTALPFLEEVLGEPLGRLVEANKKDPVKQRARTKRSRGLDFDDMFERLLGFQRVSFQFAVAIWCFTATVVQ